MTSVIRYIITSIFLNLYIKGNSVNFFIYRYTSIYKSRNVEGCENPSINFYHHDFDREAYLIPEGTTTL